MQVKKIGQMPPFYSIAEHVWGKGADIDSDGNSEFADSMDWDELTIILRQDESQRIDIDPVPNNPNVLSLSATTEALQDKVVSFLRSLGAIE